MISYLEICLLSIINKILFKNMLSFIHIIILTRSNVAQTPLSEISEILDELHPIHMETIGKYVFSNKISCTCVKVLSNFFSLTIF